MLSPDLIRALARKLYDARKSRTQLRHFSRAYPHMTIDDGYAIQREWVRLEQADGRVIKGRKIGLTSRAMQQASQITEPDFAPLMDDMFFACGDIPARPLHRAAGRGRAGVRAGASRCGTGRHARRRARRHRLRDAGRSRSSTRASSSSTATRRRRARCSTRSPTSPPMRASCLGGARVRPTDIDLRWVGALLEQQRRDRGDRTRRGRARPSGHRRGLAREQDRAVRRATGRRRRRARGLVYAADHGARRRPLRVDYGPLGVIAFRFV